MKFKNERQRQIYEKTTFIYKAFISCYPLTQISNSSFIKATRRNGFVLINWWQQRLFQIPI